MIGNNGINGAIKQGIEKVRDLGDAVAADAAAVFGEAAEAAATAVATASDAAETVAATVAAAGRRKATRKISVSPCWLIPRPMCRPRSSKSTTCSSRPFM